MRAAHPFPQKENKNNDNEKVLWHLVIQVCVVKDACLSTLGDNRPENLSLVDVWCFQPSTHLATPLVVSWQMKALTYGALQRPDCFQP